MLRILPEDCPYQTSYVRKQRKKDKEEKDFAQT